MPFSCISRVAYDRTIIGYPAKLQLNTPDITEYNKIIKPSKGIKQPSLICMRGFLQKVT